MSYRALLFCPDETAARLVTEVLSELDFTVELSFEPFVTVKKLSDEAFDAVVVDCQNEENAALLFKGARNSSLNHSSLCVAVVEGQMGVAKAFRIGANLVLTKPINTEQSKGTLRVARGLLRKTESKPRPASEAAQTKTPWPAPEPGSLTTAQPAPPAPGNMAAAAAASEQPAPARAAGPSSLLEAEQEKSQPRDSDNDKPRESMPSFLINKPAAPESTSAPAAKADSETFAAAGVTSSAAAAAPAMAPIPRKPLYAPVAKSESPSARQIKSAVPLATHEAIVPEKHFPDPAPARVPTFSSYQQRPRATSGTGSKFLWTLICLLVLAPAGYFGWLKFKPMRYLSRWAPAVQHQTETVPAPSQPSVPDIPAIPPAVAEQQNSSTPPTPASDTGITSTTQNSSNPAPEGFPTKENIDVGQLPEAESNITVVSKPEPLKVKQKSVTAAQVAPTPPSLDLPESNAANATVAKIVSADVPVVRPPSGSLRISEGVTQGLLITKVAPVYPLGARQLRKQGAVELLATVSKTGAVTQVKVISGDAVLAHAAIDAVRQWKYRPFLLNDEPVQIETQITIKFKLPN
jgi:protein TonB